MFTTTALLLGALGAVITGLSKTALPGAGLLAIPLFAMVTEGRLIPGTTLPVLIAADLFAVSWYRHHTRWDLLRPLVGPVLVGFGAGTVFFVVIGKSTRPLDIAIGLAILVAVSIQVWRTLRRTPPREATTAGAMVYGGAGGFTTFVSNSAGPIMNTYLLGLGLDRQQLVGTSAWFYFAVNLAKIPVYVTLMFATDGGAFFTGESLLYDLCLVPFVIASVLVGRRLLHTLPQGVFSWGVLVLSTGGAIRLLVG